MNEKINTERLGTVGLDRSFIVRVKIYAAKRGLTIRAWIERVIQSAMKRGE